MSKIKILTLTLCLVAGIVFRTGFAQQPQLVADTTAQAAESESEHLAESLSDGEALISNVTGTVKILRSGSDEWIAAQENNTIQEGDQIRTDSGSSADIVYDDSSLNAAHIDENTIAEFRAMEPTLVYLADGSIFNSLEALPEDQNYEVATDTAVNSIRGTKFLRTFQAANQTDSTVVGEGSVASFSVMPDGSKSSESVLIQKDNSLTLTPELIRNSRFSEIRPASISPEHRQRFDRFSHGVEMRLERFAGGPEALRQRRENARLNMGRPEFRETFQRKHAEMSERRHEKLMERRRPDSARPEEAERLRPGTDQQKPSPGGARSDQPGGREEHRGMNQPRAGDSRHSPGGGGAGELGRLLHPEMDRQKPGTGPSGPGQLGKPRKPEGAGPQGGMGPQSGHGQRSAGPAGGGGPRPQHGGGPRGGDRPRGGGARRGGGPGGRR